jgi:hypothetical protein
MKVFFKKAVSEPSSVLTIYSSLNPIPFTLKINSLNSLPETIYTRNLSGENFIELRFCKNTKRLYEITLIALQIDTVKIGGNNAVGNDVFYNCYIDENCELDISKPIQIMRSDKSLSFIWGNKISENYYIAKDCIIGIDANDYLCSISLIQLSKEEIYEILGF